LVHTGRAGISSCCDGRATGARRELVPDHGSTDQPLVDVVNVLCKRSLTLARALVDGASVGKIEADLRRLVVLVLEDKSDEDLDLIERY
jgi:hypothetical protein